MFLGALRTIFRDCPDRVAAIADGRLVSFAELDANATSLASQLGEEGLAAGDAVGITIKDEYLHFVASLALMRLGCVQITLASHDPADYRELTARRTRTVAVLAENAAQGLPAVPTIIPEFSASAESRRAPVRSSPPLDDAVCMYLTSSGTTGRAKIIPITYQQLYRQSRDYQLPAAPEVLYRPTPIDYNNSKRHRLYNLAWGGTNVFADARPLDTFEICQRYGVTRLSLSPLQASTLTRTAVDCRRRLPGQVQVRLGGAIASRRLRLEIMADLTPNLHVTYATSDFGSIATAGPSQHRIDPAVVGSIHPGVQLEIVDGDDRPLPAGEHGHIRVRSPGMATAYFDDPEATAEAFRHGWFYPGDVGRLTAEGLLLFDGRSDEMINLASINIFPAEVENTVAALPGVVECAMFSIRSRHFGDVPLLAVVSDRGLTAESILDYARQKLSLRAPRKVFLVDHLPRNVGGKIARSELLRLVGLASAPGEEGSRRAWEE
ncbi:MAG: class I adenylate-forming enzyme family protein [Bauldia sp.]